MRVGTTTIVHLSDVHLSRRTFEGESSSTDGSHASEQALKALQRSLAQIEYDVLVISGDLTDDGELNSYLLFQTWIESRLSQNEESVGLCLKGSARRQYCVVPGDTDRARVDGLAAFDKRYDRNIRWKPSIFCPVPVEFCLLDSITDSASHKAGFLDCSKARHPSASDDTVKIAVMHHYLFPPPGCEADPSRELSNADDALAYINGANYHAVLCGHAHRHWFEVAPLHLLLRIAARPRALRRTWRRLVQWWLRKQVDEHSNGSLQDINRRNHPCKNGNPVSFDKYTEYLFLRGVKSIKLPPPEECKNAKKFYENLEPYTNDCLAELRALSQKRLALSFASSVSSVARRDTWGYSVIELTIAESGRPQAACRRYDYKDGDFVESSRSAAPSLLGSPDSRTKLRHWESMQMRADVAWLVPLEEEYRQADEVLRAQGINCRSDKRDGVWIYFFERPDAKGRQYNCAITFVDVQGGESMAVRAGKVRTALTPRFAALVGIAGGLSKDVRLGDVIAPREVRAYLHRAKAESKSAGEIQKDWELKLGGSTVGTTSSMVDDIANFRYASRESYEDWSASASRLCEELVPADKRKDLIASHLLRASPEILTGNLACGDIVGAAKGFSDWLKAASDRNYLGIETESPGLLRAMQGELDSGSVVIFRGVSDFADERKAELEEIKDGSLRKLAMRNAFCLSLRYFDEFIARQPVE
jgi:3',5'-cyclic AMP phosphodiesterase CpdA/nucleoside phosphorylase